MLMFTSCEKTECKTGVTPKEIIIRNHTLSPITLIEEQGNGDLYVPGNSEKKFPYFMGIYVDSRNGNRYIMPGDCDCYTINLTY